MEAKDLEKIFNLNGIKFQIKGQDYVISCPNPNHEDLRPSCRVGMNKEVFHCFSCGAKGSWFSLVQLILGKDSRQTRRYCEDKKIDLDAVTIPDYSDKETIEYSYDPYLYPIKLSHQSFLNDVKRINDKTLEHFKVGSLDDYLLIPVYMDGEFKGVQKRYMGTDRGKERFLSSFGLKKEFVLYNHNSLCNKRTFIVESAFSVMRLHQLGAHAEAVLGTAIGKHQLLILKSVKKMLIFFDNDFSGDSKRDYIIKNNFDSCDIMYVDWNFCGDRLLYMDGKSPDDFKFNDKLKKFIRNYSVDSMTDVVHYSEEV